MDNDDGDVVLFGMLNMELCPFTSLVTSKVFMHTQTCVPVLVIDLALRRSHNDANVYKMVLAGKAFEMG